MTNPATILIVDDYQDALDVWRIYLRGAGFRVLTAANGDDALSSAWADHPDLVVLDLDLPGRSGVEVARALRATPATRRTPLIAVTGCTDTAQLRVGPDADFDAVIVKPCDPDALVAAIRRQLAGRSGRTLPVEHSGPGSVSGE